MSLRKKATKGLVWTFTQQFGNQIIGFIISLVLARILLPEQFGLIGMISVVLAIGNSLLDGGTTNSLIRDPDSDDQDYSTIFFYQLGASILIYFIIFLIAPIVAGFYEQPVLIEIIRIYGLTIIIGALSIVQFGILTKQMNFKKQTIITIPSAFVGGVTGILLAYSGFGVWSLVYSAIASSVVKTGQMWFYSDWKPSLIFNSSKFYKHFKFGYKLTISDLLNRIFNNIFLIAIGKFFSPAQVGFYTRAETMNQLPVKNISRTLEKVTFSLFVKIQDDHKRLKTVYKKILQLVVFVLTPFMIFLGVMAEPVFRFLFTEKWLPAVPYFQILCITGIFYPLHSYNLDILNVKGRSDLFLKLEIAKKILILITLVITLPFGIMALLYGQVFISICAFFINSYYSGKFLNYTAFAQIRDITPVLILASVSGLVLYIADGYLQSFELMDIFRIGIGFIVFAFIYLFSTSFLKFNGFKEIYNLIVNK